jgi:NADH:ubiquinone oxidoreductase subunit F (NADH-binding)
MTAPCAVLTGQAAADDPVRLLSGLDRSGGPAQYAAVPYTVVPYTVVPYTVVPYAEHVRRHGPLPPRRTDAADLGLLDLVERSGLLGRGGAGFPTGRKMRAVAGRARRPVVVANGMDGEPVSRKDTVLLRHLPHLVVDGIVLAARAVGATDGYLCVHSGSLSVPVLRRALAERDLAADAVRIGIEEVPARYVSGEASALVHWLNGGPAVPLFAPRPHERGVGGRPTLVQNVETLANVAMIARRGPGWLRAVGTPAEPGSLLVTVSGAVSGPGVIEVAGGTPIGRVLAQAGAEPQRLSAVLVGGYFGGWLPIDSAQPLPLSHAGLRSVGLGLGAGVLVALPASACGLRETARVAGYLAGESSGQCGPCRFGLPSIAGALSSLAGGPDPAAVAAIERWSSLVQGRGGCHLPDGAVRFVASALRTFHADVDRHARFGPCPGAGRPPVLPVPGAGVDR